MEENVKTSEKLDDTTTEDAHVQDQQNSGYIAAGASTIAGIVSRTANITVNSKLYDSCLQALLVAGVRFCF